MIKHEADPANPANPIRFDLLRAAAKRFTTDGLSNLKYQIIDSQLRPLYTWLLVDIGSPPSWCMMDSLTHVGRDSTVELNPDGGSWFLRLLWKKRHRFYLRQSLWMRKTRAREIFSSFTPCTKVLFCGGINVPPCFCFVKGSFFQYLSSHILLGLVFLSHFFFPLLRFVPSFRREKTAFVLIFLFLELFLEFFFLPEKFWWWKRSKSTFEKELTHSWGQNTWHL